MIENKDMNGDISYKFGSTKMDEACVILKVRNNDPILYLEKLQHNIKCIDGILELEKGKNGTCKMLYSVLAFADKYLKGFETVELQDSSTIECNQFTINLSDYKMITKGRTWYEEVINNLKPTDEISYKINMKLLKSKVNIEYKDVIEFLKKRTKFNPSFKEYFNKERQYVFEKTFFNHYNNKTWLNFFNKIDTLYDCNFFLHTLHLFIKLIRLTSIDGDRWTFDIKDQQRHFEDISVSINKVKLTKDFVGGYRIAHEEKQNELNNRHPKLK